MVEQVKTKSEPHVRFRGFDDEWEQVKLGDVADFRRGSFPQPYGNVEWYDGENSMSFVQVVDVGDNLKLVDDTKQKISKLAQPKSVYVPTGTVVVTLQGSIGRVAITQYPTYVDRTLLIFEDYTLPVDVPFWAYVIQQKFEIEKRKAPGGTIKTITKKALSSFDVELPSLPEQQKIGELFQTVDKTIDLSNTQVENLKQQKKALLQRLFPQKGETEPKVRLRGFTDDWEEVTLGDVFSVYSEKGRTDLPFVTVGERETNERTASAQGYGNDVSDKARAKAKVLLSGQFLIDLSSYGRGIYMSRMDGVTSSAYNVLNLDNGADSYWVEYLISHDFVESLKRLTPPGARQGKMIEVDGLLKTKTFVPSLDEQQAIGELFQTLDEQIRLAEDKVSQYKELKQALLQRLFV